jgi:hypothetical protein
MSPAGVEGVARVLLGPGSYDDGNLQITFRT